MGGNGTCDHRLLPANTTFVVRKCAWGISIWTWAIWLGSSTLLLIYSLVRNDTMFVIVQIINMLAIAATIILVRRSYTVCPYHLSVAQKLAKQ